MDFKEKGHQNLMKAIKAVHKMIENSDIEKYRVSQDSIGAIYTGSKEVNFESAEIDGMEAEWVVPNRPHQRRKAILYCHGGGFKTGSFKYARSITTKLASTTSLDVLCFDYRLAPENPYPAAFEDSLKAWDYLMYLGYGAEDVIVAGDSAGGNIALILALKLKEQGRKLPKGIVCISPWTDLTMQGKSHETRKDIDPVLSREYLVSSIHAYVGDLDLTDPFISPVFADFTGFPPVYIQVGDNEILLHDSVCLYKKLKKSDVYAKIDIYKGMWHVFQMSPFKKAYDAMDKIAEFIFEIGG